MAWQMRGRGYEAQQYDEIIKSAWSNYQHIGEIEENELRSDIIDSWVISKDFGVNPMQNTLNDILADSELMDRKKVNQLYLSYARKQIQGIQKLSDASNVVLSIVEKNGIILESVGTSNMLRQAEASNIHAGGIWSEQSAGTNAIGIALRTGRPAQVLFSEHYCLGAHDWYCMSFPILAPITRELIGIINIASNVNLIKDYAVGHVIVEASNLARSIENHFYEQTLQDHLYARKAIEVLDEVVLSVDLSKQIVSKNNYAMIHQVFQHIDTIEASVHLNSLVEEVFQTKREITNEIINEQNQLYQVNMYPVFLQYELNGVVVFIKEDKQALPNAKQINTPYHTKDEPFRYSFANMIGTSIAFSYAKDQAEKAAKIPLTLMLLGETGTGKDVFAQSIHQAGERGSGPFIAVNSAAMPESLLESELFGYEAGTFTGGNTNGKKGKFEAADQGTIFLDEIGDMPLSIQAHLLRILEERSVTRIGSNHPILIDVRVIAATNKNLEDEIMKGNFREDLYYRLHVIKIDIPPLRDRKDDIPLLATSFIHQLSHLFEKEEVTISREVMQCLQSYHWPGNIRELKNMLQQAMFHLDGNVLEVNHLPTVLKPNIHSAIEDEKSMIVMQLEKQHGNVLKAAKAMGVSRATMYRRINKYNILL